MTKAAVSVTLGFILTLAGTLVSSAQDTSTDMAVNRAVINQANTIVLRQKLMDAKAAAARRELVTAAKLYEDAYTLTQQIGSGIDAETAQTISGLVSTRFELARIAQQNGDLREAATQINRVLKVDPQNTAALAFKQQNDKTIASLRGRVPDEQTLQQMPAIVNEKRDAGTLVQNGKLLYEMGKYEEAEAKLKEALKMDPNSQGAYYYLNLVKQAVYKREEKLHTIDTQERMVKVEQQWVKPANQLLPVPNPYATNTVIHTGAGRETIIGKLQRIKLDTVMYDGLPLSEVVRNLSEQAKLRDPDKKGINFLISANGGIEASPLNGLPGGNGGATTVDPATGLPVATAGSGAEAVDISSIAIKINPALSDVPLSYVLDAIVQVAEHPIKYSIEDYAIVFSPRGAESPQLYTRTFKVDPNTFYQGLQAVSSFSFATANNSSSSGGGGGGGGGGSGGNNQNNGAVVPVVNISPGASNLRQSSGNGGNGGGGGGGGGGNTGGANPLISEPFQNQGNENGGVMYVTAPNQTRDVSMAARLFFTTLGVNLDPLTPEGRGKSLFFNDRLGVLFVRATMQDLDTIERAIQALNQVAPQIHIKSRFIEVLQNDDAALGFDWYLGNFVNGKVIANGGSAPSLSTGQAPGTSAANPLGFFPGNTPASIIPGSQFDQQVTSGLRNTAPALATVTGILTDPNFRVVLRALQQRGGTEILAEPEVTTTSGRQTQMRATDIKTIITGFDFQNGGGGTVTPAAQ